MKGGKKKEMRKRMKKVKGSVHRFGGVRLKQLSKDWV